MCSRPRSVCVRNNSAYPLPQNIADTPTTPHTTSPLTPTVKPLQFSSQTYQHKNTMKCSAVMAFLALSAHAATAASESANFDKLLGLVAEIQAEAAALAVLYHDKDLQFASLQQLCDETTPTPTPDSPTLEPTPVSTPRRTPEPQPEPSPTPTPEPSPTPDPQLSPTSPEPEPSPEPTPEPVDPTPSSPSSGWIPKIGDHWNYNLNTPVDTSIDVNVFFIDMGESFVA